MLKRVLFILLLGVFSSSQGDEYQSVEGFLSDVFSGSPPTPKALWFKKELREAANKILQHKISALRTRYWKNTEQSVWIINEIGKIKPITVAVVIKEKKIAQLKVLAFRESRGWEVKHEFFTHQFKQNSLDDDLRLTQAIDGISGATLSVRAVTKAAQLALLFDSVIQK